MNFRYERLEILIEILDGESFNEKLFQSFISCEHFKAFMEHEKELGRKTSEESIKENIKLALKGVNGINESYGFAFMSKERLDKKPEYFNNLDNCIRECAINNNYSTQAISQYFQDSIPNYVIGFR